ncbi:MAG: DUF624 domain-containing protein [Chloroflexi bacterium]|nr:DUF624 domain-containing protein [Chloroflexota bacterium]
MINKGLRDKLTDAYVATIPLITLNVVWLVTSLPLVTLIPSTAALFYATNHLAHGKSADMYTFFEGFRLYFRRSWFWGLLNLLVIVVLASNFLYYGHLSAQWATIAEAIVIVVSLVWLSLQVYSFPLLLEQEKPDLRLALRNSLILLIRRPFFTFGAALLMVALAVFSSLALLPLWFFFTASTCTYLANLATLSSIAKVNRARPTVEGESVEADTTLEGGE